MASVDIDVLVNKWLIARWLSASSSTNDFRDFVRYDESVHGPVRDLRVSSADADWDCGCYSSWTREDDFVMKALIETRAGQVTFEYGFWGLFPSFIEELDAYRNNTTCPYEREDRS